MNYSDLSPFMLLDDPDRYHNALKKAKTEGLDCSDILNDTTLQDSWYSPHVLMLAYLVGDQTQEIHEENKQKSERRKLEEAARNIQPANNSARRLFNRQ